MGLASPRWGRELDVPGRGGHARLWHVLIETTEEGDGSRLPAATFHAVCGVALPADGVEIKARMEDLPEFFPACLGCLGGYRPPG